MISAIPSSSGLASRASTIRSTVAPERTTRPYACGGGDMGDRERAGDAAARARLAHGAHRLGTDRRRVARQDEHVLGAAGERREPDLDRVAGAVGRVLDRDLHARERRSHLVRDRRRHDRDDVVRAGLLGGGHHPGEHGQRRTDRAGPWASGSACAFRGPPP